MTLSLLINGVDYTSRWRPYESRWTMRGHMLESMQSEFILDDFAGDLDISDVRPRKIVEVWEDASGSPVCLYRGRIASKTLGRGPLRTNPAMRWRIMAEDPNVEVRGIRIVSFNRDAELDTTRVEVLRLAYLNGASSLNPHARDSTTLGGTYIQGDSTTTLDPDHYTDTYPDQLLLQVAEDAGKQVFVYLEDDGTMELFYGTFGDSLALTSDIEINDDGSADGEDVFAPYYSEATAEHDGQRVITGGGLRYGPDDDYFGESDINGTEATYDKWEEHLVNEYIDNETEADRHVTNVVHVRQAEQSYTAVIDMRPEQVHRIKAGMVVNHQQLSAAKTLGLQRASQVQYEPVKPDADGNSLYRVTIELGRPRSRRSILNTRRRPTAKPIPRRPQPSTGACTRLYFTEYEAGATGGDEGAGSADAPAGGITHDAGWDVVVDNGAHMLTDDPLVAGAHTTTSFSTAGAAAPHDFVQSQEFIALTGDLLTTIQAGGATVHMQAKARSRFGTGISEAAQDIIGQKSIRVVSPDGSTVRGTALAMHSLASSAGSSKWPAQAAYTNRVFPPAAASNTLSAVASAQSGDFLVIEIGGRSFYTGPTGGTVLHESDQASDLPEDEVETGDFRAWIDICTSEGGDTTSPTVLPGEETSGDGTDEDGNPTYVGPDHTHSHGLLADDGVHMHDADQIDGLDEGVTASVNVRHLTTAHIFPIIAHHGDINPDDGYPENTIESFRQAVLRGVHGVEFDVQRSADGTWYAHHDLTVTRTTDGTGNFADKTDAQIAALNIDGGFGYNAGRHGTSLNVPALDDVLDTVLPYDPVLFFDLKEGGTGSGHTTAATAMAEYVVEHDVVARSVIVVYTIAGAAAVKDVNPTIEVAYLSTTDFDVENEPNIDRLYAAHDDVTNLAFVTARIPKSVDAWPLANWGNDELVIMTALWERGVRSWTTDDVPNALAYRRQLVEASAAIPETLDDLSDVDTTGAVDGDVLTFDGSEWVPEALGATGLLTVDAGQPTYDDTGDDLVVTYASDFGYDADGPYYEAAGAAAGEEAILAIDTTTGELTVIPYSP